MCCTGDSWQSSSGHAFRAASFFGDYNCDLPPWSFEALMRDVARRHPDLDYVVVTGDYPPHDVWRQNRRNNLESSKLVAEVLRKHFGGEARAVVGNLSRVAICVFADIPVFPTIGNHEAFPVNMFPGMDEAGKYNPSWLYSGLTTFFQHWITGEEQRHTMMNGGYYQALVRPGLRLVSINTNYCNSLNFFLLLNFDDPSNHLHWIYSVLHQAEQKGEKVLVIGHIPPGSSDCFSEFNYR